MRGIAALRRFRDVVETHVCDGCGVPLGDDHDHVLRDGACLCACASCSSLGAFPGAQKIGKRVFLVDDLAGELFARLRVPVDLAFIVRDPKRGLLLRYPSPAGIVEDGVAAEVAVDVAEVDALLFVKRDDVVLLLRVPIDVAFALTGLLRKGWTGLHGDRARQDVKAMIDGLVERMEIACLA